MEVCIIYIYIHGFKEIVMNKCIFVYIYIKMVMMVMEQWSRKSSKRSNSLGCSIPFIKVFRICLMKGGMVYPHMLKNIYPGPIFGIVPYTQKTAPPLKEFYFVEAGNDLPKKNKENDVDDLLLLPCFFFQKL